MLRLAAYTGDDRCLTPAMAIIDGLAGPMVQHPTAFGRLLCALDRALNGSTEIALMLLDVLSGIEQLQVAVAYEDDSGRRVREFPAHLDDLQRLKPVYETLPGWAEDISGVRRWADLPTAAREYATFLGRQVGVPVSIVSVGPDRSATLRVEA